ncbi:MAG: peptide-methionine (S)-S-oxide reductase MsrA [Gammaproteobacteria bacterium]|nr:MAG: peptide-methionine (S)-S-oxide reductase MsrA [Gammaproteobacteria bacterium]
MLEKARWPGNGEEVGLVNEPRHLVLGTPLLPPYPGGMMRALFGMGCFWGAERAFWQVEGVHVTAAGYAGGHLPEPGYRQVCRGDTGHAEVVLVVFDPDRVGYRDLLRLFWESHDPTQGMRQGNDVGNQYRSFIGCLDPGQCEQARESLEHYQLRLHEVGLGDITTEIAPSCPFYHAEPEHQQYLARNPGGYCGLSGTGVRFD